ncbi:MAG: endonuclease III [Candidatus Nitrohelix vancouverensis]|uniref:Endonuclease III n=1 Tax=Candidatus Nitrohelix vancouverensis TaxID=2705534 RepID=A0A7T0C410_9BACT|nr:MAG: endonuclease III [Candidatus Nitrohelix vancouverensis]
MDDASLTLAMRRLKKAMTGLQTPVVVSIGQGGDPFRVLLSCLLSLRTRDETTGPASERLFQLGDSPRKLLKHDVSAIETAIYPVAFFRNKAKTILELCRELEEVHSGKVPNSLEGLLKLKGVGRKTANLTYTLGFGGMGICVDIHVHRIVNRWGYVATETPDDTEEGLRKRLPRRYWKGLNDLLVTFGQNICRPASPFCSRCPVEEICAKTGVTRSR